MAIENLYRIQSFEYDAATGVIDSDVELDNRHPVFEGHFPGNPVLPGVCTVQMAKEILCRALQADYRLSRSANIKYLGFVSPDVTPEIHFHIVITQSGPDPLICSVTVTAGGKNVCSFKGDYIQI